MNAHPAHGPAPIDASLHLLADHLVEGLVAGDLAPSLLHVSVGDAEGFDLGLAPLDGRHPSELLIGTTAPPDWHAIGVATGGWAYHVSDRGSTDRRRSRVHVVTLVSRTGELAHRTEVQDPDAVGLPIPAVDEELPTGEQVDLLRLALGLPTDPPPCDTGVYWAILWLSDLLGTDPALVRSWRAVAERHPGISVLRQTADGDSLLGPEPDLVMVASQLARGLTWRRLRQLLARGGYEIDELTADDGEWFDDGAFARFVLNRCPPLPMLRRQLSAHLDEEITDRVLATLDRLGIPDAAWPDSHAA